MKVISVPLGSTFRRSVSFTRRFEEISLTAMLLRVSVLVPAGLVNTTEWAKIALSVEDR